MDRPLEALLEQFSVAGSAPDTGWSSTAHALPSAVELSTLTNDASLSPMVFAYWMLSKRKTWWQ